MVQADASNRYLSQEARKQGCEPITGMSPGDPWSNEEIDLVYKVEGGGYEVMERRRILLVCCTASHHIVSLQSLTQPCATPAFQSPLLAVPLISKFCCHVRGWR